MFAPIEQRNRQEMLPLPPIPTRRPSSLRDLIRRVDSYTLWAFNPQPPLVVRPSVTDDETTVQKAA